MYDFSSTKLKKNSDFPLFFVEKMQGMLFLNQLGNGKHFWERIN